MSLSGEDCQLFRWLFFLLSSVPYSQTIRVPQVVRNIPFEDIRPNTRLAGNVIATYKTSSLHNLCIFLCYKNSTCRSINYCGAQICELNSDDIFSTVHGSKLLRNGLDCKYYGMKRNHGPNCEEGGKRINVQEGDISEKCATVLEKQVDRHWGAWEPFNTDNVSDWIRADVRAPIVEAAHGGSLGDDKDIRVFEWYRWFQTQATWDESVTKCSDVGGKLFSAINGTTEQLDFISKKIGFQHCWMGIYTEDHIVWKDTEGNAIPLDLFIWEGKEPDNRDDEQFCIVNKYAPKSNAYYLGDQRCKLTRRFMCDML